VDEQRPACEALGLGVHAVELNPAVADIARRHFDFPASTQRQGSPRNSKTLRDNLVGYRWCLSPADTDQLRLSVLDGIAAVHGLVDPQIIKTRENGIRSLSISFGSMNYTPNAGKRKLRFFCVHLSFFCVAFFLRGPPDAFSGMPCFMGV
jgi:hypothetical protein